MCAAKYDRLCGLIKQTEPDHVMNNLREIKGRLRSIRKNKQILSAMKMVSAVKLRRIQAVVQVSRPYAQRLEALVQTVPLSKTMDEQISRLRAWAEGRARNASVPRDTRTAEPTRRMEL